MTRLDRFRTFVRKKTGKTLSDQYLAWALTKSFAKESQSNDPSARLVRDFPDYRQDNHWRCGLEAWRGVVRWFTGEDVSTSEAEKLLHTSLKQSTDPSAIIRELRNRGIAVTVKRDMTIEDLRAATDAGRPVIVCIQDYGNRRERGASFKYGHYLTVLQCRDGVVTCQDSSIQNVQREPGGDVPRSEADPSGNVAIPGRVLIDEDEFLRVWHDQRANGEKLVRFGIACGPLRRESITKGVAFDTVQAAGKWLAGKWAALESRYGRNGALAMAVGMIATSPLPGNIAAVIAVAEGIRGVAGYLQREFDGDVTKLVAKSVESASQELNHLWNTVPVTNWPSHEQLEQIIRRIAAEHSLDELKKISRACGVATSPSSKTSFADKMIARFTERLGRWERGQVIGDVAHRKGIRNYCGGRA